MSDLADLLGKRVRIWDGPHHSVRAEGEVVGIIMGPSIVVRDRNGNDRTEPATLPRDIVQPSQTEQFITALIAQIHGDEERLYWRDRWADGKQHELVMYLESLLDSGVNLLLGVADERR